MKLYLRRKAKRHQLKRDRIPLYVPHMPEIVWSADFVSYALAKSGRFRTLLVVDDFNRELSHIEVDTSISLVRLVRIFEQLQRDMGCHRCCAPIMGRSSWASLSCSGPRPTA